MQSHRISNSNICDRVSKICISHFRTFAFSNTFSNALENALENAIVIMDCWIEGASDVGAAIRSVRVRVKEQGERVIHLITKWNVTCQRIQQSHTGQQCVARRPLYTNNE